MSYKDQGEARWRTGMVIAYRLGLNGAPYDGYFKAAYNQGLKHRKQRATTKDRTKAILSAVKPKPSKPIIRRIIKPEPGIDIGKKLTEMDRRLSKIERNTAAAAATTPSHIYALVIEHEGGMQIYTARFKPDVENKLLEYVDGALEEMINIEHWGPPPRAWQPRVEWYFKNILERTYENYRIEKVKLI